jgi:hypothetical protein
MVGEAVLTLQPIKWTTDIGEFRIHAPGSKDQKPLSLLEPEQAFRNQEAKIGRMDALSQRADTLWLEIETEVTSELSEAQIMAQLEPAMHQVVYRFLRLLRRKLPETPMRIPAELLCNESFSWQPSQLSWKFPSNVTRVVVWVFPQTGLTKERWEQLRGELISGADTELWEDFLLDAKVALHEGDLIRATLYAAIACETFIKHHTKEVLTRIGVSNRFWSYISSQEPQIRAIRYYGPILHLITGHSLEDENKELYKSLEHLFTERNKIMHEGKHLFSDEERRRLGDDIRAAEQAIPWVCNLENRSKLETL